jgi:hypothetical protein
MGAHAGLLWGSVYWRKISLAVFSSVLISYTFFSHLTFSLDILTFTKVNINRSLEVYEV